MLRRLATSSNKHFPAMASFSSSSPASTTQNALKLLDLSPEDAADFGMLKARFITLAKQTHPDLQSPSASATKFAEIREAFNLLLQSSPSKSSPSQQQKEAMQNFDDWFRRHCFNASPEQLNELAHVGETMSPGGLDKGGMWELAQRVAAEEAQRRKDSTPPTPLSSSPPTPMFDSITSKLTQTFSPTFLQVLNESHMHNVPKNSETHFKVVVISDQFKGVKLLQRHKLVNVALKEELEGEVHALSIVAKDIAQFETLGGAQKYAPDPSPSCRGGDGSLPPKTPKP
ncbi:hypothetical protein TrLO_g2096 [Triparma laevis f. longispina]|uniref:J domain-containing protein n=1 Tax=Triparma laevis f. longispina TaxID=1714387 RepID=A0A9W7KW75_9STRA|nr:hypothetical protein TrLO_g2096 [Triparma laevis f. longispina]